MVRHHAVGLGLTTTSRGVARTDTIGLTVDRGDAMGEGGEIGDGVALDAEEMQTGSPWQDLVETIDDGDQSIRAMDGTPAHTADTNEPGTLSHVRERLGATLIITGMTSLNDRHEGSIDPGIFGTQPAFDVGTDRSEEHTSELQSLMRSSYA